MILPSDSDLPPERNDDSNPDLPDDVTAWWEDPALTDGDDETDDGAESAGDEDVSFLGDPEDDEDLPPALASVAGPGWRKDLYKDLLDSLRELEAIEDPDDEFAPPEPPDLFTFFGELAALRTELRHQGQRTNDNLNQLDKAIAPLVRAKPGKAPAPGPETPWPVPTCLALVSAWDLLPHATSSTAFEATLAPLLKAAGLTRIPTVGLPFDAAVMTLAGTEKAGKKAANLVLREVSAGFLRDGALLRPASVITSA